MFLPVDESNELFGFQSSRMMIGCFRIGAVTVGHPQAAQGDECGASLALLASSAAGEAVRVERLDGRRLFRFR